MQFNNQKMKKFLFFITIITSHLIVYSCSEQNFSHNNSNKEFKKAFGDLYVITLVINYMDKDYEKETFPLFDDCEEGMKAAEKKFNAAPLMKLKKIKCIPLNEVKFREKNIKNSLAP